MEKIQPKQGRNLVAPYSKDYQDTCFAAWYQAGHPAYIGKLLDLIPVDEHGRKPAKYLLYRWMQEWKQRADVLDAESTKILDTDLIAARVEMLEKQAAVGEHIQELGLAYFEENGIKDEAVALRAVIQGAELERQSRGLAVALQRIAGMSNENLQAELQKQLNRFKNSQGEVVEGDVIPEDTESEESEEDAESDDA